jgi:hypothetical protein
MIFCANKIKTPQRKFVCHTNMHKFAQYGVILTNYAMVMAINSSSGLKAMKLRTR